VSIGISAREFSHASAAARQRRHTRIAAAVLTAGLYTIFALFAWWPVNRARSPAETAETTAELLPDVPAKRVPPPPFLAHLVKPHAVNSVPPEIIVAPDASSQLSASTTPPSPLLGGVSGGASGAGTGLEAGKSAGCLDAAWMRAVTERVRQFFTYPAEALAVRRTGLVMVHFEVRRSGEIEKLRVSKSSGDEELDKAALEIMRKAQPLPAIPDRMHTERVAGEMPINFGVRSFSGNATTATCGG
jgi:protein TonB